ncbi:MAG TPA: acetate/propionate family kinase [Caulobacteraceae bacterium]|jgi:acetate kinase|nr:acetate/propionate family kinase [Caulobacteraceae bacterium]
MGEAILALNAGSSSLKFALFRLGDGRPVAICRGELEDVNGAGHFRARDAGGVLLADKAAPDPVRDADAALAFLLDWTDKHLGDDTLACVGHRIVHGGRDFTAPVRIDDAVMRALDALCPLAPLHQPHNLAGVRAVSRARPNLIQTASFDTAFHAGHDAIVARFAIPRRFEGDGVRRYGFHGLSYDYISHRLAALDPALARGRVIAAHLGNGASLCALANGKSVDTTMGFSALDGLVMGTRCGLLDPGVLLYLQDHAGLDSKGVSDLLYKQSGLLGVSGISGDVRALLASDKPEARDALDLFAFRAAREAAAMTATLGGLDGIVFSAGIGENAAPVRAAICERLAWLGVSLDTAANAKGGESKISTADSSVTVWIVPTDEEATIVRDAISLLDYQ